MEKWRQMESNKTWASAAPVRTRMVTNSKDVPAFCPTNAGRCELTKRYIPICIIGPCFVACLCGNRSNLSHRVSFVCAFPPPLDLWFWSIYQEEPPSSIILCVLCFVCVCVGNVDIFLTPHTCHDRRSCDPLFISHPICVSKRMQMLTEGWYVCILKGCGVSECSALECCQGSRCVRAAAALFVFHCCSNNGSPWADSPPNWETTERKRARRDGAAFTSAQLHTHADVYVGTLANWQIYVRVVLYEHYTLVIKVLQSHCTFSSKRW